MSSSSAFYTMAQVAHNFGSSAVVGGTILANWPTIQTINIRQKMMWMVLVGWVIQALGGVGFGAISYADSTSSDIKAIATAALLVKLACSVMGFTLTASYIRFASGWSVERSELIWRWMIACAGIALTAAALLRWFID